MNCTEIGVPAWNHYLLSQPIQVRAIQYHRKLVSNHLLIGMSRLAVELNHRTMVFLEEVKREPKRWADLSREAREDHQRGFCMFHQQLPF